MLDVDARSGMARTTVEERLAEYDRRHRELAAQIAEVGIVAAGSVTRRFTRCTSVGCRCNADPPTPPGPYWQWTEKENGKTVTKPLTDPEAHLYQEWIGSDRRIVALDAHKHGVAAKHGELLLKEAVS